MFDFIWTWFSMNSTADKEAMEYTRNDHFKQYLDNLQAKPITKISSLPDAVINCVEKECSKQKLQDRDTLTAPYVRRILKKHHMQHYMWDVYHIIKHLGGQVIELTDEQEATLIEDFDKLSIAFNELLPEFYPRLNFLSYGYVCVKLCQRHKITIPDRVADNLILKSIEKLVASERIYKRLCNHLNWDFQPIVI